MAIYNAHLAEDLLDQERTRRELELARKIQRALLPKNIEHQMIYGVNMPARKLSGDFYDYFELEDGRIFFNLGDVAGKGANAALLMAKTTSLFRCLGKTISSPAELLFIINNEINENITHGLFVTMVAGIYDPAEKRVTMANAGHQPPLYVTKEHTDSAYDIAALDTASPPLGVLPNTAFEEYSVNLNNHALYIFTDGLTECWEEPQKPLGETGVKRTIEEFSSSPASTRLEAMISHVTTWKREASGYLFDDITMLLIQGTEGP
jgi:sigma-B regulation protein RsbU (phosphoserine phosphatase)